MVLLEISQGEGLYEIHIATGYGIEVKEELIPVKPGVRELCDIMGMDYLGMANEGKVLLCVKEELASQVVDELKKSKLGKNATIIGKVTSAHNKVLLDKGNKQMIIMREHTNIPRIC